MKRTFTRFLRSNGKAILQRLGYEVRPFQGGLQPFKDAAHFLRDVPSPIVFDVGANVGQTAKTLATVMPQAQIHSFEPSPATYAHLRDNCADFPQIATWNVGMGSRIGQLPFIENTNSDMSSFLAPGDCCWGEVDRQTVVPVTTIDSFAHEHAISNISLLKSDTQGYDFEVFKGAHGLFSDGRIGMVYFEFIFSAMYEHLPKFDEVYRYLADFQFHLVGVYGQHRQRNCLGWADLLFVHESFRDVA